MKTIKLIAVLFLTSLLAVSCSENEVLIPADLDASLDVMAKAPDKTTIGNEAPNGAHYNLNIIGMDKEKTADMTGSNGHVIFVGLGTKKTEEFLRTHTREARLSSGLSIHISPPNLFPISSHLRFQRSI